MPTPNHFWKIIIQNDHPTSKEKKKKKKDLKSWYRAVILLLPDSLSLQYNDLDLLKKNVFDKEWVDNDPSPTV